MATKKPQTSEVAEQIKDNANVYIDRLLNSHERFADAVGTARARTARVADKFFEIMIAGQRDAIELSKSVVAEPAAYGKNMEAIMHSLTAAQERALDLAKTVYREQSDAAAEARALTERALAAGKSLGQPFAKMSSLWMPTAK